MAADGQDWMSMASPFDPINWTDEAKQHLDELLQPRLA